MELSRARIVVVTPAPAGSTVGNRVTAERWARTLRELGTDAVVVERWLGEPADALVALHAVKSLDSIERWHAARPLVVGLAGTDVYGGLAEHAPALAALRRADRIVALQPLAAAALPADLRARVRTIVQSALSARLEMPVPADPAELEILVLAHLRAVKDPLLPARAARRLRPGSRIAVRLAGRALDPALAAEALAEEAANPRFRMLGELAHADALARLAGASALALPSRTEGGANALGEAAVARVPILAARNAGAVGLLGDDHPGLFPVGDAAALAALFERFEADEPFRAELRARSTALAPRFDPARERAAWRTLFAELDG
jgi:putative glycosyltransferase (TIGR04348 family)